MSCSRWSIWFLGVAAPLLLTSLSPARADTYYVANTRPPDAYLAMRSAPSSTSGHQIETMANGTPLEILDRRPDGWRLVRDLATGRQGWALSGSASTQWIVSAGRPAPAARADFGRGFRTPSGNIFCQYSGQFPDAGAAPPLRCDLTELARRLPPPADCPLDWGDAFEVSAADASGSRVCHGDTVRDDTFPVLNYGTVWTMGGLSCTSAAAGLTCLNGRGHGFRLSSASQQVF